MIPLRFGNVRVEVHKGYTRTLFPDGAELTALHAEQPGQAETAQELGYKTVEAMNRDHDVAHSVFAHMLGLPYSGSLYTAARRIKPSPVEWLEEAAVLSFQAYAVARGVDILQIARRITAQYED